MDLNEILVFTRVVQTGSITAAAAQLGMPKSTVSRKVTELEERLKARLLQRTTRKLSLTDVGRIYYDYCARIIARGRGRRARRKQLARLAAWSRAHDGGNERGLARLRRERLPQALSRGSS